MTEFIIRVYENSCEIEADEHATIIDLINAKIHLDKFLDEKMEKFKPRKSEKSKKRYNINL